MLFHGDGNADLNRRGVGLDVIGVSIQWGPRDVLLSCLTLARCNYHRLLLSIYLPVASLPTLMIWNICCSLQDSLGPSTSITTLVLYVHFWSPVLIFLLNCVELELWEKWHLMHFMPYECTCPTLNLGSARW